jgi:dihydrofolate reductase
VTRVVYFTASTLDGFIADEHDSLDWLFEVPHDEDDEDDGTWDEFIDGIGVLVMGATTYEWAHDRHYRDDPSQWHKFYGDLPGRVFTHRDLPALPGVDIVFTGGDVATSYDAIVAAAGGKNVWLLGGGDLVGQFDDAGLLDEIHVGLTPVTLGAGAPLLPRRITSSRMRFREARQSGQRVRLVLDVARPAQA